MQIVRRSAFKATPWKNGGGVTHEGLRMPPAGDPFLWRVSVAEIGAAGPFSDFTGYRRTLVLLAGGGMLLKFADGSRTALRTVGEMAEFDGARAVHCDLPGGPCRDLNLMWADTLPPARVRIGRVSEALTLATAAQEWLVLFCIEGRVSVSGAGTAHTLEAGDLAAAHNGEIVRCAAGDRDARAPLVFRALLPPAEARENDLRSETHMSNR